MTDEWKNRLDGFFNEEKEKPGNRDVSEMAAFIKNAAMPAFAEISAELEKHGRFTDIRTSETSAAIIVQKDNKEEFTYRLQSRTFPNGVMPYAEIRFRERGGLRYITVEAMIRSNTDCSIRDIDSETVVEHFVRHYTSRVERD
ncbi:MAG: hypothetical protein R6V03_00530 [Kiritimatiellia bacterium]